MARQAESWLEFVTRDKQTTVRAFQDDHILCFFTEHSVRQNFLRNVVYETEGPGRIRTPMKYVDRALVGNRAMLVFRRLRRRAREIRQRLWTRM